jgi:arabinan endo-1,5-alpha-L-arabinosidase
VSFIGAHESDIGVAISYGSLEPNDWVDRGSIGLPQDERWNTIDPYVFWDQNDQNEGHAYLTFGSYWSGIQQIELSMPRQMTKWQGNKMTDIKTIISNTTASYAVVEGAITHKEGKFFYQFFSVGQCCRRAHELMAPGDEYHVAVCRSESAKGPYFDKDGKDCSTQSGGTTILASHGDIYAPGGQGVMVDPKTKRTVMYYHYGK